jgi:hypothetical protein|tara:strand:+ start:1687 stop:1812 length:126 start_codon:yes stop_codon:yes gene_type:complete
MKVRAALELLDWPLTWTILFCKIAQGLHNSMKTQTEGVKDE